MRQPHCAICGSVSTSCTTRLRPEARATPELTQKKMNPAANPAVRGAVSTTKVMAPGSSPPRLKPWMSRSRTIRTAALVPMEACVGNSPMPMVAIDIDSIEMMKTRRRPYLSPKWLKTMPPIGRAK